jgi:hypothetical protein
MPADRFDNPVWQPSPLPWEAGVFFHYGERRDAGDTRNIWAQLDWEIQATRNWKLGYDTRIIGLEGSKCKFCGAELNFRT